jgi:radical SAM/Cys-rich protein
MNEFEKTIKNITHQTLMTTKIDTFQVNIGLRCNQQCHHCHLKASPGRNEMMTWPTMKRVIDIADQLQNCLIDVTGGAPELHPQFKQFIQELHERGHTIQVRTNLTVLLEPGFETLPEFLRDYATQLVASLPCYTEENVRAQRGPQVYEKSITTLMKLNDLGYGVDPLLKLTIVYNPGGPFLPSEQQALETDYRRELMNQFGIRFTNLITITNMPIGRFLDYLKKSHQVTEYLSLLKNSFNPQTVDRLMCRHQICVGWDGTLYDCDFNGALNLAVNHGAPNHIRNFDISSLSTRRIMTGAHCYGCTAGYGSSCKGALS